MCAEKFLLVSMRGPANGQTCIDGERGPPSARAEINYFIYFHFLFIFICNTSPPDAGKTMHTINNVYN
jgi:hypothetical protein